jgi:hypothetical protein
MKPTLFPAGPLWALAVLVPPALCSQEAPPPGTGPLRRLDPTTAPEDPSEPGELFGRDFDGEVWKRRLAETDLERREKSLDGLLRRARLDPVARAFLEELARDGAGGELAWTARLALRELGRARFPLQAGPGPAPFGIEPLTGAPFGGMQRMQELMNEFFAQEGFGHVLPRARHPGAAPTHGRSVQLEQRDGRAVLRVTEIVDGKEDIRRYEGASLEEILTAHPELREELGGLSLQLAPGSPLLRRFPAQIESGVPLLPQGRSRPVFTDRLGVVVHPLEAAQARELGLEGGLLVERSVSESYAHLLGIGPGAILLELDGVPLRAGEDIERRMKERGADDALSLVWIDELGQRQAKTWRAPESGAKR